MQSVSPHQAHHLPEKKIRKRGALKFRPKNKTVRGPSGLLATGTQIKAVARPQTAKARGGVNNGAIKGKVQQIKIAKLKLLKNEIEKETPE